jgi:hypothetical protein
VVAINFPYSVCGAVLENVVKEFDFMLPVTMRSFLEFRKHERLARIEATIDGGEIRILGGNLEDAGHTKEVESCAASFEDEFVREYKERGFTVG